MRMTTNARQAAPLGRGRRAMGCQRRAARDPGYAVCALVVAASSSAFAWLIGPAVNQLFSSRDNTALWLYPLAIVAAATDGSSDGPATSVRRGSIVMRRPVDRT